MASLDTKDSRSTLVEGEDAERQRSGTPHPPPKSSPASPQEPASPFSASFDPNAPTPLTPPTDIVSPLTTIARNPPGRANTDAWTNSISTSLSTLATQFSVASQALAAIPAIPASGVTPEAIAVIQQAQDKLEQELESLKEQVTHLLEHGRRSDKEKERAYDVQIDQEGFEGRLQGIEQRLEQFGEIIKLDQARLYGRLQNSVINSNKVHITPLVMANGKIPPNFPATKGEFEHLTKERYEQLLKSYGLPIKGDTAAKRQTVREFLGLTPAS